MTSSWQNRSIQWLADIANSHEIVIDKLIYNKLTDMLVSLLMDANLSIIVILLGNKYSGSSTLSRLTMLLSALERMFSQQIYWL